MLTDWDIGGCEVGNGGEIIEAVVTSDPRHRRGRGGTRSLARCRSALSSVIGGAKKVPYVHHWPCGKIEIETSEQLRSPTHR